MQKKRNYKNAKLITKCVLNGNKNIILTIILIKYMLFYVQYNIIYTRQLINTPNKNDVMFSI